MRTKTTTLKRAPYGNCIVRNSSGDIMFRCGEKKINWYLKRNLAVLVGTYPPEIKLTFQPKGNGWNGKPLQEFYNQDRENICVVCGSKQNLTRHHVVPNCFRVLFPEDLKNHSHHDVLPLCMVCHDIYEGHANDLKRKFAIQYNAPMNGISVGEFTIDRCRQIKAARASANILVNKNNLPDKRRADLIEKIKSILQTDEIDLVSISKMEIPEATIKTQAQIIIEKITNIKEFAKLWRKHFLKTMHPKFLPKFWGEDYYDFRSAV
jgi:hypothetical protein